MTAACEFVNLEGFDLLLNLYGKKKLKTAIVSSLCRRIKLLPGEACPTGCDRCRPSNSHNRSPAHEAQPGSQHQSQRHQQHCGPRWTYPHRGVRSPIQTQHCGILHCTGTHHKSLQSLNLNNSFILTTNTFFAL